MIASHTTAHPSSQPYPLWSEQNPADWWSGMVGSIRAVLDKIGDAGAIKAIGLTGQMHGLVCLDQANSVLRPAILWNDQRTQAECDEITEIIGAQRLIQLTGNRVLTGFTVPKIVWVQNHEPEIYAQIAHVLLPKDYIRFKLTRRLCRRSGRWLRHGAAGRGEPPLVRRGARCAGDSARVAAETL